MAEVLCLQWDTFWSQMTNLTEQIPLMVQLGNVSPPSAPTSSKHSSFCGALVTQPSVLNLINVYIINLNFILFIHFKPTP